MRYLVTLVSILLSDTVWAHELRGLAMDKSGQRQFYTEQHIITLSDEGLNKKIETKYFRPDGSLFATMSSDFSQNYRVPNVIFEDLRFQKKEELVLQAGGGTAIFRTTVKGKSPEEKKYEVQKDMVAGQGFDNFVKMNFEKMSTKPVSFSFGVLSEMDFFSFAGYRKAETPDRVARFGIRMKNLLFRLFSNELLLEYDRDSRRLISYRGLSNLLSDEGKSQEVFIKYETAKP